MSNQGTENRKEKKEYCFNKLPENIRQIGEQPEHNRIYIEDYVITYIHQVFQKKQEKAIVVLLGKKGEGEAKGIPFVYGAVELEMDVLAGNREFNDETWDKIYERIYEHFTGAQVLGWGCGVSMWNSQIDEKVRSIQQKHFAQEGKILFLEDLNEKEEKIFCWKEGKLAELSGYVIYYEKNPLMQDYMLQGQPKESFEAAYDDKVTATVRAVVQKNEELRNPKKVAAYSVGVLLVLLTILGANLLIQSTKKIDSLEKTIETLSDAAVTITGEPQKKEKVSESSDSEHSVAKASGSSDGEKSVAEASVSPDSEKSGAKASESPDSEQTTAAASESPEKEQNTQEPVTTPDDTQSEAAKKSTATKEAADSTKSPAVQKTSPSGKKTTAASNKKSTASASAKKIQSTQAASKTTASYVVRAGDTLSQIVWRQYHTLSCMEMVKDANHIKNGDKIKEGQRIILPAYSGRLR